MDLDTAEAIAISALTFLAGDEQRLGRFLALTGLGPAELKAQAHTPRLLAAVLDHVLQDENLLLVFAASSRIVPELITPAQQLLAERAGGSYER
jgi:hypothetical protein